MRSFFAKGTVALLALASLAFASDISAQEMSIAFTLATGANITAVQHRVTSLEAKAIADNRFSDDDKAFLHDLYAAMAIGAKSTVVFRQSGRMMDRYLEGSGAPLELDATIFSKNARVRQQMSLLAKTMSAASSAADRARRHRSPRFYMPDPSTLDSVTGLYWGTVEGTVRARADGTKVFHWRAEVPWEWPSYESLRKRYGTPHAETFVLPNPRSIALGTRYALHIENGLGEHLVRLGIAKPFVAWAEWEEPAR